MNIRWDVDVFGRPTALPDVTGMASLVRCLCAAAYDLQAVEVLATHADCTVFKAPCCGRRSDDREWKSLPDYVRLDSNGREVQR